MTLVASNFLGGAKSRLLPASIPFRYFGAAIFFHVAFWIVMAIGADDLPDFRGGQGPALAAIHLLTLGVLAMTAMGAAFQLLPVATKSPLHSILPTRVAAWFLIPGVVSLGFGMGLSWHELQAAGAAAAVGGLGIFAAMVADNLRRTSGMVLVTGNAWGAIVSLAAILIFGFLLIVDQEHAVFADHGRVATAHMILAVFGFMGMLALGFSTILVPMFALSPAPSLGMGMASLALYFVGLVLAVVGTLGGMVPAIILGGLLGFVGVILHLRLMLESLSKRMRRKLGPSFAMVRIAWTLLPIAVLLGIATAVDLFPRVQALWGFAALGGWLLTFVLALLQRIIPFLASMHAAKTGRAPPLVSALTPEAPLKVHFWCHLGALVLVGSGIAANQSAVIRFGALVGTAGALAFAVFFLMVMTRLTAEKAENKS